MFAGTFARTMAQTFIHPIDTIKTRLQVKSPPKAVKAWKKSIKKNPVQVRVSGTRVIKFKNWLINGPRDVYLGVAGSFLGTLPVGLAYFAAYEGCKHWLESSWKCMKYVCAVCCFWSVEWMLQGESMVSFHFSFFWRSRILCRPRSYRYDPPSCAGLHAPEHHAVCNEHCQNRRHSGALCWIPTHSASRRP